MTLVAYSVTCMETVLEVDEHVHAVDVLVVAADACFHVSYRTPACRVGHFGLYNLVDAVGAQVLIPRFGSPVNPLLPLSLYTTWVWMWLS